MKLNIGRLSLQSKDNNFSLLAYESGIGKSDNWEANI